jgi:hypothetical protein
MKTEGRASTVALLIAAMLFVLYLSWGTSQPTTPPPSAEQQKEVAALKQQIAALNGRVDWLEERFVEPRRDKESPF